MAEPIEWRVLTPATPRVRWGVAVLLGRVVGGGIALPAIAAVRTSGASRLAAAVGVVAFTAAAGGVVARYRTARDRTPFADALSIDVAGVRWLPLAGLLAAGLLVLVAWTGDRAGINLGLVAVAVGAVGFVVVQSLRGTGRFDPDSGTATFEGRVYDLARAPTTPISLGRVTILVVRRPAADPLRRYGVLAMSTTVYARVRQTTGTAVAVRGRSE